MLFRLTREGEKIAFQPFMKRPASALRLAEKDLENWISGNPGPGNLYSADSGNHRIRLLTPMTGSLYLVSHSTG